MPTYRDLFNNFARLEGSAFDRLSEDKKEQRVLTLNEAIRWAWYGDYPAIPLPYTIDSGTVTVTAGKILASDLGDGTYASLWTGDPQGPDNNDQEEVDCTVGHDGLYPVTSVTEVFAFFRRAVPQGVYAEGDAYATPADIPAALLDIVPLRAALIQAVAAKSWETVNGLRAVYGEPRHMKDAITAAMLASGMPWQKHYVTLFPAAV